MKNIDFRKEIAHLTEKRAELVASLDAVRLDLERKSGELSASYLDGGSVVDRLTAEMAKLTAQEKAIAAAIQTADIRTAELREKQTAAELAAEIVRKNILTSEVRLELFELLRSVYAILDQAHGTVGKIQDAGIQFSKEGGLVMQIVRVNDGLRRTIEFAAPEILAAAKIESRGQKTWK